MKKIPKNSKDINAELTFTQSLKKLKEITDELDKGDLELEDALKLYEEGMDLHKNCQTKLFQAQLKIEEIKKKS